MTLKQLCITLCLSLIPATLAAQIIEPCSASELGYKGKVKNVEIFDIDPTFIQEDGSPYKSKQESFEFARDGKLMRHVDAVLERVTSYTYDKEGNLSEIMSQHDTGFRRTTYTYEKGMLKKSCVYNDRSAEPFSYADITCNADGVVVLANGFIKDDSGKFVPEGVITIEPMDNSYLMMMKYPNGNPKMIVSYHKTRSPREPNEFTFFAPDGTKKGIVLNSFGNDGNMQRSVHMNGMGQKESTVEYTYDEDGNKTREVQRHTDGKTVTTEYKLDRAGNPAEVHSSDDDTYKLYRITYY